VICPAQNDQVVFCTYSNEIAMIDANSHFIIYRFQPCKFFVHVEIMNQNTMLVFS
jgi:hypothetical protein